METVVRKKEEKEIFKNKESLSERELEIEIMGQTTERSMEDRSVYVNIKYNKNDIVTWINGEKAIELGQMLIKHGTFALESNMINHQRIHSYNILKRFLNDKLVKYINLIMVDENPVNYGKGFCEFKIKPQFYKGKSPKYQEDFEFGDVMYFTTYDKKEFLTTLDKFGGSDKIIFHNYKHEFWDDKINSFRMRDKKLERILK